MRRAAGKEITLKSGDVETKASCVTSWAIGLSWKWMARFRFWSTTAPQSRSGLSFRLTTMPSIVWKPPSASGGYGLGVMYATEGLSWSQRFSRPSTGAAGASSCAGWHAGSTSPTTPALPSAARASS
ncbi:MAG: hypothetical protein IPM93_24530 [Candidatus Obscuribacter sp.]|nr:hypothetical protein [Candidatus Obscuribacter sp.]